MAFNGRLAATKLVEAITRELYALPGFDNQFAEMVQSANECRSSSEVARRNKLQDDETPELVHKEIWTHVLAYNLIRTIVAKQHTNMISNHVRSVSKAPSKPWKRFSR